MHADNTSSGQSSIQEVADLIKNPVTCNKQWCSRVHQVRVRVLRVRVRVLCIRVRVLTKGLESESLNIWTRVHCRTRVLHRWYQFRCSGCDCLMLCGHWVLVYGCFVVIIHRNYYVSRVIFHCNTSVVSVCYLLQHCTVYVITRHCQMVSVWLVNKEQREA